MQLSFLEKLSLFLYLNFQGLIGIFPDIFIGNRLRHQFYKFYFGSLGTRGNINANVHIEKPENIFVGDCVEINRNCWLSGGGGINIGNNVLIGPHVIIHSANHNYKKINTLISKQGHAFKKVTIEDDVWIAAGVIILPGVRIGKGAVVAAGAVVTKDVVSYTVVAGIPAKKIGNRELD